MHKTNVTNIASPKIPKKKVCFGIREKKYIYTQRASSGGASSGGNFDIVPVRSNLIMCKVCLYLVDILSWDEL